MNLRGILPILLACAAILAPAANASNVFVLPPSSQSGNALVFSELLAVGGSVAVPSGIHTTLVAPSGTKAILLSSNAAAPVSFVTLANGQVSGPARPVLLDGLGVTAGVMTPDGQQIVAVGGADPGKLFIIDVATETVVTYGRVLLSTTSIGTPKDLIVTHDSRYALVLSTGGGRVTAVNLLSGAVVSQTVLTGFFSNISISPTGAIYVTATYDLYEFQPEPPFAKVGRSRFYGTPGKLYFSPNGRYAVAANEQGSSSSFFLFDNTIPGSNDTNEPTSMGVLNQIPIQIDGAVAKPTKFYFRSDSQLLVYFGQQGRFWTINFPSISSIETNFGGSAGVLVGVTGATLSDEYPIGKFMYFTSPLGQLTRLDLSAVLQPSGVLAAFGDVFFGKAASSAAPATVLPYGAGQTVGPAAVMKPYAIRVLDAAGRPVFNAPVLFTPGGANVGLSTTEARTNLAGLATVTVTSPNANGDFTVTATVGGISLALTSKVEGADPGPGGGDTGGKVRVEKVAGDGQLKAVFFETNPLVIRVLGADDQPIVGREVTWSTQSGVQLQGEKSTLTDANGEATIGWRGNESPQLGQAYITYYISATVAGIGTVTFVETGYLPSSGGTAQTPAAQVVLPTIENSSLTKKLGSETADAFRVHVFHPGGIGIINNTPIPNVGLTVTSENQDPAAGPVAKCKENVALSDATGFASCTLVVSGTLGKTDLVVDVGGGFRQFGGGAGIAYTLTVTPGDPGAPVIISGNNQKGKPGALLPLPLVIEVSDGYGNLLGGLPVSWVLKTAGSVTLSSTSTVTAANGRASTVVQLGSASGTFDIDVTVGGKTSTFKVSIESQLAGFSKIAGDNQSGIITNQPFPTPLSVKVSDTMGQPVSGVTVTFAVTSGSAVLGSTTALTASTGLASVAVTAGPVAGNVTISASIANFQPLVFTLSSRLPGPVITAASFRNYSTNESGIAPGVLARISGQGIAPGVNGEYWANMLAGRLPTEKSGIKVEFTWAGGSAYAPIMAVGNDGATEWVLVQVPYEMTGTTASATITVSGGVSTVTNIPVRELMPGVIEDVFENNRRAAIIIRSDGLVVTPTTPARKGETVRMYAIGMGQTTPLAETNRVGIADQRLTLPVQVGLETGKAATVVEAKLAENLIGIYEILFTIPDDAPTGSDLAIACSVVTGPTTAVWSNESKISIAAAQ